MDLAGIPSIPDETAKALQEGFKAYGATVELVKAFGGYVSETLGTVPSDLVKYFGGDWLNVKRAERAAELAQKARERLRAKGIEPEPVSPSLGIPLFRTAADEERPELVELWTKLLEAAQDPNRASRVRRDFIDTIAKFEPLDAVVFAEVGNAIYQGSSNPRDMMAGRVGATPDETNVSLLNLNSLNCVRPGGVSPGEAVEVIDKPYLTSKGRELLRVLGIST